MKETRRCAREKVLVHLRTGTFSEVILLMLALGASNQGLNQRNQTSAGYVCKGRACKRTGIAMARGDSKSTGKTLSESYDKIENGDVFCEACEEGYAAAHFTRLEIVTSELMDLSEHEKRAKIQEDTD